MMRSILMSAAAIAALSTAASAQQVAMANTAGSVNETVVVTASPLTTDAGDTAAIAGKVNREQILQSGGGNLADALETIPGVTGSSFAAGASRPVIRGFDSNRVRLMEDGIGAFDVSDVGPDHGVPIDPLSAQTIEVVRGAATLRYGSQAIGGVVNAINNRVPTVLPDTSLSGELSASYGSNADLGQGSALVDGAIGKVALHADAYYRTAGDYSVPDGRMDNSFFRGNGGSLGASYFFDESNHIGAAWVQYDARYGIPAEDAYILMRQTKFLTRAAFDFGSELFGGLTIDGGYANYSHEEKEPDGTVGATFKNREFDLRAEQLIGAIGPFSATAVGFQMQHREYSALGEASDYLYPTITTAPAFFLFTEAPLADGLRLQIGGRIENVHITGTPASDAHMARDFTPLSGALGVVYDATNWLTLGFTASSAARAPAQTELFARGAHDGPATFEIGDPTMGIERANSVEASARINTDAFSLETSLWSSWFDNYIYGALTGRMCEDDGSCAVGGTGELKELLYSQSSAHFRGAEAKATYRLMAIGDGALSLEAQADYVRATLSGGGNVPRIPPYHVGAGLSWQSARFDAGMLAIYAGKQNDYGAFDSETPGYWELNMHMAVRPLASHPGFEIALIGHNLTDDVQRNAAAFNKDDVIMPGREIRLMLRQRF